MPSENTSTTGERLFPAVTDIPNHIQEVHIQQAMTWALRNAVVSRGDVVAFISKPDEGSYVPIVLEPVEQEEQGKHIQPDDVRGEASKARMESWVQKKWQLRQQSYCAPESDGNDVDDVQTRSPRGHEHTQDSNLLRARCVRVSILEFPWGIRRVSGSSDKRFSAWACSCSHHVTSCSHLHGGP